VVDIFGILALETIDILRRVQKVVYNNDMSFRSINIIYIKICFAIQTCLAAQFVTCLPSIRV